MKVNATRILTVLGLLLVSACASGPQPYHTAQQANLSNRYTVEPLKDAMVSDHMHRFLDQSHSVLYMQNQGGGGAAVGLLFGPLGALANIEAIKKQTNADAAMLQGKLPVDVNQIFTASLGKETKLERTTEAGAGPVLSPGLYVEKLDDAHVRFASLLYVQVTTAGKTMTRQYIYELPESYARDEIARGLSPTQVAQLAADAASGFDWMLATYTQDIAGAFNPDTKATIHSDFVTPRIQIAFMGHSFDAGAGRVGFAMGTSAFTTVYSLPEDAAKLTM